MEVDWYGKIYYPKCTKEVILSSGTIGSPYLLLHSGIGPNSTLSNLDVSETNLNNFRGSFKIFLFIKFIKVPF